MKRLPEFPKRTITTRNPTLYLSSTIMMNIGTIQSEKILLGHFKGRSAVLINLNRMIMSLVAFLYLLHF